MIVPLIYTLLAIGLIIVLNHFKNRKLFALGNRYPGPPQIPIIGNIFSIFNKNAENFLEFLIETRNKYGSVSRLWIGSRLTLLISDPKAMEVVLSSSIRNLAKNNIYDYLVPWLGDGLLLSKGKKWHNRRKIITPAFHFKILEQFVEIFDKQSKILVQKLKPHDNGEVFDVNPYVTLMALDVISETAMGTEIHAQTDSNSEYVKAVHIMTLNIASKISKIWQRSDLLFKIFANTSYRKECDAIKLLHDFTIGIIKSRRQKLIDSLAATEKKEDEETNKKMAFLDILLQSTIDGLPLSNNDIREEVDTFMFEGHDTTTAGINFPLYLLSRHKEIQDKVFEEIVSIFGTDKNTPATYRNLQDLKYMELVIKESMRLFPPVPGIGRCIDEDTPIDEHRIMPKDSNIILYFYLMFRDPNYFSNPDKFDPERFSSGAVEHNNPFAYIPFSAGSRNCIGQKFAILEIKSVLSKVLRFYELLPIGQEPIAVMDLIMRSTNGVQLGLKPRTYNN